MWRCRSQWWTRQIPHIRTRQACYSLDPELRQVCMKTTDNSWIHLLLVTLHWSVYQSVECCGRTDTNSQSKGAERINRILSCWRPAASTSHSGWTILGELLRFSLWSDGIRLLIWSWCFNGSRLVQVFGKIRFVVIWCCINTYWLIGCTLDKHYLGLLWIKMVIYWTMQPM